MFVRENHTKYLFVKVIRCVYSWKWYNMFIRKLINLWKSYENQQTLWYQRKATS